MWTLSKNELPKEADQILFLPLVVADPASSFCDTKINSCDEFQSFIKKVKIGIVLIQESAATRGLNHKKFATMLMQREGLMDVISLNSISFSNFNDGILEITQNEL